MSAALSCERNSSAAVAVSLGSIGSSLREVKSPAAFISAALLFVDLFSPLRPRKDA